MPATGAKIERGIEQLEIKLLGSRIEGENRKGKEAVNGDEEHRARVVEELGIHIGKAEGDEEVFKKTVWVENGLPRENANKEIGPEGKDD